MPITEVRKRMVVEAIDRMLEATSRRNRKQVDTNASLSKMEREFAASWRELQAAFSREWNDSAVSSTFEAKRHGPTKTQVDALYNRARVIADKLQREAVNKHAKAMIAKGAASAMNDLGPDVSWSVRDKRAEKWLKSRGIERVKGISENSRERIRKLILDGLEAGKNAREIGKEVEHLIKSWYKTGIGVRTRGQLIAVTEIGEAYEQGRLQVRDKFEKAGLRTEKSWLTAEDQRVCSVCTVAEEDGWIPGNQEFSNGADAPLAHAGDRCDLLLQVAP